MERSKLIVKSVQNKYKIGKYWVGDIDHEFNDMKFDVIVSNPPYQSGKYKQLYVKFIELSLNLAKENGFVCVISPKTWLKKSKIFNKFKNDFLIHYLNIDKCANFFPNISTTFSYFIAQYKNDNIETKLETEYGDISIKIQDHEDLTNIRFLFDATFRKNK